jgi:hypothetical protein
MLMEVREQDASNLRQINENILTLRISNVC